MGKLKKIFFSFMVLFFIQVNYGYLYPANGWPTSFTYHYGNAENLIENMFEDEKVSKWFNRGYNPDDRYSPINKENKRRILEQLKKISDKAVFDAIAQVKNCSDFNKLFEKNASKNLSSMKNRVTFTPNIPGDGYGTVGNYGIFVKDLYLKYFLYHMGKQAREIENGQRTDFDLTPDHFDHGWGGKAGMSIKITIPHELIHFASGFNGGGRESECIVHCLTKKCIDSNYDFKDVEVETIINWSRKIVPISCHKIEEKFWEGKKDIADEMDAGDCFCGIEWVENANCDEPIPTAASTAGKKIERDKPDDHYSFAAGINYITNILSTTVFDFPIEGKRNFISFNFYPDILIYEKYFGDIQNLLNKYGEFYISDYVHDCFSNNHKILFIGSGELIGDEKSAIIKQALENFVANGGVLFAQTQQYGTQIEALVPIPENESLRFIGFRQDQSCVRNSGYFRSIHPAVSSSTTELLDMGLDGYFPVYPSGSTVLLRRRISEEPALLYYPYKNGWVILGANFTDYSLSKSMASTAELKITRDLLAFAKNPDLPILMVDLEKEPIPTITRDVTLRNPTGDTAVKAILKVYTPDKDQVLYETQENITLNPGDHGEIPVTFSLTGVTPDMYGIWHVFYELYNSDNDLIFLEESDTGRFALYKITTPYTSNQPISAWITVQDELLYFSEPAAFEFHLKNNSTESKTLDLKYSWNHELFKTDLQTITIPAGEQVDLQFDINAPPIAHYVSAYRGHKAEMLFRLWYGPTQTNQFNQATKGIQFMTPKTESSIVQIQPDKIPVGKPFSYKIKVNNESDTEIVDAAIAVTLEKLEWPENNYVQVSQLYETLHTFTAGETFSYNGNYTPTTPHESGMYRLKMAVQKPEGTREENYGHFLYINSNIGVSVEPLIDTDLVAGTTYPVKIMLAKKSFFDVLNGRYSILFKTPDGQTACRKDVENLVLTGYRSIPIEDAVTFTPTILAPYYRLVVEYSDETILTPRVTDSGKRYPFKYSAALALDKEVYLYRETANVSLKIEGAGTFDVHFTCAGAGIDEQRVVIVPAGSVGTVEVFPVPIGLENYYNARFAITSREGFYSTFGGQLSIPIPKLPLQLEANGTFGHISANVGTPIDFNLTVTGISGFTAPLPGQLKVSCMNYTDVQNVTLLPIEDNNFSYHIPVEESLNAGTYHAFVSFSHEGRLLISKNFPIKIPGPDIKFAEPPAQLNAGDSFVLSLENPGGKNGEYQWEVYLKDQKGNSILEYTSTNNFPINAGQKKEITLEIPGDAASGPYILLQKAKETNIEKEAVHYSGHQVTGVYITLNTYTLKEKYFANEPVSGKAEITSGSGDMENGQLQSGIVRFIESQGIEEQKPGEFIAYNMIESGFSSGTMLYLVADKGVLAYDVVSGTVDVRYSFDDSTGFNSKDLLLSSAGELWIASTYGIWKQTSGSQWEHYTTADGLANNWIYDIMEVIGMSGSEIWAATSGGISVFRGGQWVNYTTADGLPANRVYRLTVDGSGAIWASSSEGVVKFNGTTFESVEAPFGTTSVSEKITGTSDGSVWMATSTQLYQYQPGSTMWNEWNLTDLYPASSVSVHDMETVNGELWIKTRARDAEGNLFNVLIHFDSGFSYYTALETPGLTGLDYAPIIPGSSDSGDSAYFICEIGAMEFRADAWTHRVIDIDGNKFCGDIQCLAADSLGRLWAGTDFGFSMYDGSQWTNYYSTTGNQLIMDIMLMDVDTQNRVYGYCSPLGGILRLYDGNTELISFPYSLGYYPQYDDKMAVDTLGRIWLGRKDLYYYDGQWHKYDGVRYVKCMIKDFNGGVWLGSRTSPNDTAGAEFHLLHIKNDFTFDDYTASNSELIPWEKDRLYLDQNGTLWIKNYAYNYSDKRSLQSFDGSNWIDYSNFTGFPALGAQDFVNNHNDQLHMVEPDGALYVLKNNEFVMEMEQTYYSHSLIWWNERLRCVGYTDDNGGGGGEVPTVAAGLTALTSYNNLLTLSGASGLMEEELWSRTYPVTLDTVDLITGKTFPPGTYELKTALMSPLQQKLANSQYNFVVKDTGLSTTLLADGLNSGFLKPDTDLGITVEVLNNTPETKSNLDFTLKKISPSGTEEMMISENFTLTPGQLEPRSVNFNESEVGIWKLTASLQDYSTGEEKKSSLLIGVTGPEVTMEVLAPEYVGDENFDVKLRLSNQGNINAQLNVQVSAGGETPLDEPLTLRPREERILTINDTISADKTYTIALSGDIEKTETKTVKYGYVENFSINIPPAYREGQVSIGYTIANGGGLAFTDQVSFELFAVGGTLPLYTTERNYSLYPDQAPIMDTIDISLLPGNYRLNYHTSKQPQVQTALLVVQPSGIGNIAIKPSGQYPVGAADITYSITNIDTFAGQVPVTLTLTGGEPGTPLLTETRDYYLLAGETRNDVFHYEFASPGDYTLNFTGPKLPAPIHSIIQVKNLKQVTANLSIGPVETDSIPVNVILENSGYQTFTGTAVIEVGDIRHEEIMDVSPGSSFDGTVELNTSVLTPGSKEVKAFLYDNAGNAIAQTTGTVIVQPANIKLKEYPENLEISAGSFGEVTLTLKNEGNLRGEAVLKINTFDTLYQEREVVLEPGEEIQLGDIFIQAPPDLPTGSYPFYYSLKGSGVENSSSAGNFNFKVNGLSLDIDASLDRSLYNPGETAALTLNITAGTASDAPLEAVVNWGIFSETRQFNLSSGSASLVFDIPLDQAREEKVFYGIYHEGGKSFHLNDIYLHFRGEISVETDKQVYAPGEMVHAVFTGEHTGILTVSAFAESYTLDFSSSASAGFQAPIDTLAGTYGIGWSLIPSDPSKPELSGSHPFDVSGLKVKVAKSELEKGKYAPGDTVNAHYVFESNRDQTLKLRNWVVPPSGDWTYLGESSVTVSSQQQVDAVTGYSFSTTEAGTHELVYGLYQAEGCENCDQLVVSGRLSFDVGNAVLLGINTDPAILILIFFKFPDRQVVLFP